MQSDAKSCELCGRQLQPGFAGTVCAICRQDFQDMRERMSAPPEPPAVIAQPVQTVPQQPVPNYQPLQPMNTNFMIYNRVNGVASYCTWSGVAWLVLGVLQCGVGVIFLYDEGFIGFGMMLILLGVWNIIIATRRFGEAGRIRQLDPTAPSRWEGTLISTVIFLILNFIFGALIGVAGAILDMVVRNQLLAIRGVFEQQDQGQAG